MDLKIHFSADQHIHNTFEIQMRMGEKHGYLRVSAALSINGKCVLK